MMETYNPILVYHMDLCPKCKNRALEMYDIWNNPIGFRKILEEYERGLPIPEGSINKRALYTVRCKKCGSCFPIRWERGYPLPDCNPLNMDIFLAKFKQC